MKKGIHPDFKVVKFTDISSGKEFMIGSTTKDMTVEISSASHPFFTGEARIIDIENRVDSYMKKIESAKALKDKISSKKAKEESRRKSKVSKINSGSALTLRDMLKTKA